MVPNSQKQKKQAIDAAVSANVRRPRNAALVRENTKGRKQRK
jgi:hypothetical protein